MASQAVVWKLDFQWVALLRDYKGISFIKDSIVEFIAEMATWRWGRAE